ncbi:MAG: multiprotein bridging factor aMBF1 [Candidatus Micrarchaeia archaeon]
MECDICGRPDAGIFALIEGAKLRVCGSCARGGKILYVEHEEAPQRGGNTQPGAPQAEKHTMDKDELDLVDDYGAKIKSAREKLGLPLPVLGERIAEKESFLDRIEKGHARPSDQLARKIEKELGIELLEKASSMPFQAPGKPGKDITLGDVIEIVRKKKK